MSKLTTLSFLVITVFFVAKASAVDQFDISGNAAGSDNSIVVQSGSSINVQQGNSIELRNDVDARANTGGNSVSGNEGEATIITGDAETVVDINNLFNQNKTKVACCTPTPVPTLKPQITPEPTSAPTPPASGGAQPTTPPTSSASVTGPSDGGNGGGAGPSGGGQVLGLSATSGPTPAIEYAFYLAASLCLSGAKLLRVTRT